MCSIRLLCNCKLGHICLLSLFVLCIICPMYMYYLYCIICSIHRVLHDNCMTSLRGHRMPPTYNLAPLCFIFPSVVLALSKEYGRKIPDLQIDNTVVCSMLSLFELSICNFLRF